MYKRIIETIVGGAIGMVALYAVARVAYFAGYEQGENNHDKPNDREEKQSSVDIPIKKAEKLGVLWGMKKMIGRKKESPISELLNNPEGHQVEAYMEEGEIHVNIRKRKTVTARKTEPSMET